MILTSVQPPACFTSISELKNRFLLQNNIPDAGRYSEQIVVWAFEAERQIGTGHMFQSIAEDFDAGDKMRFRLPNNVYDVQDLCLPGSYAFYTGFPRTQTLKTSCGCARESCCCLKWSRNGSSLNFSRKVCAFTLTYTGIAVDGEGFPMITESHIDAITAYLDYMLAYIRWKEGKVSQSVKKDLQITYQSKFRACRSRDNIPGEAEARTISNIMNTKLPVIADGWRYSIR